MNFHHNWNISAACLEPYNHYYPANSNNSSKPLQTFIHCLYKKKLWTKPKNGPSEKGGRVKKEVAGREKKEVEGRVKKWPQ